DPDNPTALLVDAEIKRLAWKWDEANAAMLALLREYPNYADAHFTYGIFLGDLGLSEKSLRELRRAAELDPLNAGYRDNIGGPLHILGRDAEAMAEYRRALALDPDFMWAFADVCALDAGIGKLDEASRILRDRLLPEYRDDRSTLYCKYVIAYRRHDLR